MKTRFDSQLKGENMLNYDMKKQLFEKMADIVYILPQAEFHGFSDRFLFFTMGLFLNRITNLLGSEELILIHKDEVSEKLMTDFTALTEEIDEYVAKIFHFEKNTGGEIGITMFKEFRNKYVAGLNIPVLEKIEEETGEDNGNGW